MQAKSYLKNAAILTATGLVLRAAGMFFRVYIAARVGAQGMGLYQLIFTAYTLAITLGTAGLSVAATRVCAALLAQDKPGGARRAMRTVLALSGALGAGAGALLYGCAEPAAVYWLRDARAALPLRILAPSLPFMALSAALRGYFMARRAVGPNARAQLFEQAVRIAFVALLLDGAAARGAQAACAAVVAGNTVSEAASWAYLSLCYARDVRALPRTRETLPGLPAQLFALLWPIAAGQYLTGALRAIENGMVPACLAAYTLDREAALGQYGALKGMAMPVLFFPFSFLGTLSTLLLPEICEAYVQRRTAALQRLIDRVMLLTLPLSILAGGLLRVFAFEVGEVLYRSDEIGFYLSVLAPLAPLMYLESMVDGILKGLNEQLSTFRYAAADSAVRIALIAALVPRLGMKGFLFVMLVSNLLTGLLNLGRLLKTTHMPMRWMNWVVKPLASFAAADALYRCAAAQGAFAALPLPARTALGAAGIACVYLALLRLTGCARMRDFLPARAGAAPAAPAPERAPQRIRQK